MQFIAAGSMPKCALPKDASFTLWHSAQRVCTGFTRSVPCPVKWGPWHLRQSRAAGECVFSFCIFSLRSLWQVRQRSGPCTSRSLFSFALWGLWHFVHSPVETGECRLFPPFNPSFTSEWHSKQTLSCFATIIPPKLDAWASWQVRHSPPLQAPWLGRPPTPFLRSTWQSAQREAPAFRRSFFSSVPCAM